MPFLKGRYAQSQTIPKSEESDPSVSSENTHFSHDSSYLHNPFIKIEYSPPPALTTKRKNLKKKKKRYVWLVCSALLLACIGAWFIAKSRTFQLFGELVYRLNTSQKVVALTFDDGPHPAYTKPILSLLDKHNVKATFFVTGKSAKTYQEALKSIVRHGHAVGNHSFSHKRMVLKSPAFVRYEISETDKAIRAAGYKGPIDFRPPYGKKLFVLPWLLYRQKKRTIMWDIEPETYAAVSRSSEKIVEHILKRLRPGSIILLHVMMPSRRASRAALPKLITRIKERGYRFVTLQPPL
ncbi:MAG TPA: polysaccharide deacetylase [Myxococcales bacterium]|nr:polysaccharide deacetylase [Myxococcales bacterium]